MGTGRKKIPIRKIENVRHRRVTFCKRRNGLFKKSRELSTLTPGCRVAVLAFSASSTAYFFDTDNDNDETHDLVSFLEQAADAVFGNPNFQIPTDHSCNRNAVPQQIIPNSTDLMQMQHGMTTNTNYTLPHEIIPNNPFFRPFEQPTSRAYTATDDSLMQLQNNTNTNYHGYNRNVVPQQIISNNTDQMRMQLDMTTNTNYRNNNGLLGLSLFGSGDDLGGGCINEDQCLSQLFLRKQRLEALRQYMLLNLSSSFRDSEKQI